MGSYVVEDPEELLPELLDEPAAGVLVVLVEGAAAAAGFAAVPDSAVAGALAWSPPLRRAFRRSCCRHPA